jgi:hypothetical protein
MSSDMTDSCKCSGGVTDSCRCTGVMTGSCTCSGVNTDSLQKAHPNLYFFRLFKFDNQGKQGEGIAKYKFITLSIRCPGTGAALKDAFMLYLF